MADVDLTPVVLGLYRHDVPETETLRALLNWLREFSFLVDPISARPSAEESKELLRQIHMEEAMLGDAPTLDDFLKFMMGMPAPPAMDDALIDRIVQSDDWTPEQAKLRLFWILACAVTVSYADAVPDDFRADGRRLIQIAASPADWLLPPGLLPNVNPAPADRRDYLTSQLEELGGRCCANVALDYATVQRGRNLPGPTTLKNSTDPRDFDHLLVPMLPTRVAKFTTEFADLDEWWLTPVTAPLPRYPRTLGLLVRLRDGGDEISDRGQRLMARLREFFVERFR